MKKKSRNVGMTFSMPEKWHTEFKLSAILSGLSMKELLEEAFECWRRERFSSDKPEA